MKSKKKIDSLSITLIIISIILLFLFVGNFLLLLFDSSFSNILTIISGWVSGFATLAVGIIAAMQSKKYNDSNQKFIDDSLMLRKCNAIVENRQKYVNSFNSLYERFKVNYKISYFSNEYTIDPTRKFKNLKDLIISLLNNQIGDFTHWDIAFITCLRQDFVKDGRKLIALASLKTYVAELKKIVENIETKEENLINESTISEVHDLSLKAFFVILQDLDNYYTFINDDLNFIIFNKYNDFEYLLKYSNDALNKTTN